MLSTLAVRDRRPEVMDDPTLDPAAHRAALRGLARLNRWSRSDAILWPAIAKLAKAKGPLRVLDVATGAGDVPLGLWRRAKRAGLDVSFAGCDLSATALDHARENARKAGAEVQFFLHDAIGQPLPDGFDVVTSSLFLHHLEEEQAVVVLGRMRAAAARSVMVNDLSRSRVGYVLAWLACRMLTRSWVVHTDGPLSVRAAFTPDEAAKLAENAGLLPATVTDHWPFRFLLKWDRP